MFMSKKLFIVHAVDAEGPIYESVKETIKRFNSLLKLPKKIKTSSQLKNALNGKIFSNKNISSHQVILKHDITNIAKIQLLIFL